MSSLEFVGEADALSAPSRDGAALLMPGLDELTARFAAGCFSWRAPAAALLEGDLGAWRSDARAEVLEAARRYTAAYRDVSLSGLQGAPLLLAGHQPQLFHPGVWFKNGMLTALAKRLRAIPINLVIDNDVCHAASVRVPSGELAAPHVEQVALDVAGEPVPYEERGVVDETFFRAAALRVREAMPTWLDAPLIESLWREMPEAVGDGGRALPLGARLAIARHRYEQRWGWETLEVSLSQLCEGRAFRRFAFALWSQAERLREDHNLELLEHRRRYRIRSRSHPVPALEREGEFVEVPFWVWTAERPRRRRLFVRVLKGERIELTDRERWSQVIEQRAWEERGWGANEERVRIRSRALTTTWFARAVLAPGFVHGIGGALYDRLTDAIVRRHWGLELSQAFAATSTLRLRPSVAWNGPTDLQGWELTRDAWRQRARAFRFRPEQFVGREWELGLEVRELAERKASLIETRRTVEAGDWESRRRLHESIEAVNQRLREKLPEVALELRNEEQRVESLRGVARVLGSREYAFALFSEERLRGAFEEWLGF